MGHKDLVDCKYMNWAFSPPVLALNYHVNSLSGCCDPQRRGWLTNAGWAWKLPAVRYSLFPFQFLLSTLIPLPLPSSLIFVPLCFQCHGVLKIYLSPWLSLHLHPHSVFLFRVCSYSPSSTTHCITLTYAWSMSDEVLVFLIPLLCFSLFTANALNYATLPTVCKLSLVDLFQIQ